MSPGSRDQDVVIAVMGATGSGKTTFISTLVEEDIGISHDLQSSTATSGFYSFVHTTGKLVTLIDTPGFNDTNLSDSEILRNIAFIMTRMYYRGIRLSGIIYLHCIKDVRISGSAKRMIRLIRDISGEEAFPRLVLTTSTWPDVGIDTDAYRMAAQHEAELASTEDFWGALRKGGSAIRRWDGTTKSAVDIVDFLAQLQSQKGKVALQIQREMVDNHRDLCDTTAGRTVNSEMMKLVTKYRTEMSNADLEFQEEMLRLKALERQILEVEDAQASLKVDYDMLSRQKVAECGGVLKGVEQHLKMAQKAREHKEMEITQSGKEDTKQKSELEYNEARLKLIDQEVERLTLLGRKPELASLLKERRRVVDCCNEFLELSKSAEAAQKLRKDGLQSLRGEEERLGKMQLAVQGLGVLVGVGLTVAGAVIINPPMISGGVSLTTSSISTMMTGRK